MYSEPSLPANDSIVIMSKPPNNSDTSSSHFLCLSVTGTLSSVDVPTFAFQFPDIDFRLSITERNASRSNCYTSVHTSIQIRNLSASQRSAGCATEFNLLHAWLYVHSHESFIISADLLNMYVTLRVDEWLDRAEGVCTGHYRHDVLKILHVVDLDFALTRVGMTHLHNAREFWWIVHLMNIKTKCNQIKLSYLLIVHIGY